MLTNEAIEELAIAELNRRIALSPFLRSFISKNDKTPIWDNFIYVYSDPSKNSKSFQGRIPVQVKGTTTIKKATNTIKYNVDVNSIRAFSLEGGALYFVVCLSSEGQCLTVYYRFFLPADIKIIMEGAQNQKTKRVEFSLLVDNADEMLALCSNYLHHYKKQSKLSNRPILTLSEIKTTKRAGILESYVIGIDGEDPIERLIVSNRANKYAYFIDESTKEMNAVYLDSEFMVLSVPQNLTLKIDDMVYDIDTNLICDGNSRRLQFGNGTLLRLKDNGLATLTYKPVSSMRGRYEDLNFWVALSQCSKFEINNERITIPFNNIDIDDLKSQFQDICDICLMFDKLNYSGDLSMDSLSEEDTIRISVLVNAIVYDKPIPLKMEEDYARFDMTIENLHFLLFSEKIDDNNIRLYDFFTAPIKISTTDQDKNRIFVPTFISLTADDILKYENFDVKSVIRELDATSTTSYLIDITISFLLTVLNAYDKSLDKRFDLLELSDQLIDWLLSNSKELHLQNQDILLINNLQIRKRQRELLEEEKNELINAIKENKFATDCLVAAYLLLDQNITAQIIFEKLSKKEQQEFKTYPIYRFWS